MCPHLEGIVNFIDMVQRQHDHFVDILLIGWGVSIINLFNQSVVYMPVSNTPNFSHMVGISVSEKQGKDTLTYIP